MVVGGEERPEGKGENSKEVHRPREWRRLGLQGGGRTWGRGAGKSSDAKPTCGTDQFVSSYLATDPRDMLCLLGADNSSTPVTTHVRRQADMSDRTSTDDAARGHQDGRR